MRGAEAERRGRISRWEIYAVDLNRASAGDVVKRQLAVVFSSDGFNGHFDVVTVLPLSARPERSRHVYEFEVLLPPAALACGIRSIVMPHQIRTISKGRLRDQVGFVADEEWRPTIQRRVLEHMGILFEPENL